MITIDGDVVCPICSRKLWVKSCAIEGRNIVFIVWCGIAEQHRFIAYYPVHTAVFFNTLVTQATLERDFIKLGS